jgi:hypothetical protein
MLVKLTSAEILPTFYRAAFAEKNTSKEFRKDELNKHFCAKKQLLNYNVGEI